MRNYVTSGIVLLALVVILFWTASLGKTDIKTATLDQNPVTSLASQADDLSALASTKLDVQVGKVQVLKWQASKYPSTSVSLHLLKKVSNNPVSYELVRSISEKAPNSGTYKWTPTEKALGSGIIVEIACVNSNQACSAGYQPIEASIN
jgi:hypothetical protein